MKNKNIRRVIALAAACFSALTITSCNLSATTPHEHDYSQRNTDTEFLCEAASCESGAKYYYSCDCGEAGQEIFTHGEALHVFDKQTVENKYLKSAATESSPAVYYLSCKCGLAGEETFEYGEALSEGASIHTHAYTAKEAASKYLKSSAACGVRAVYYYSCACGEPGDNTFEYGDPLSEHSFNVRAAEEKYLKSAATCQKAAVYYYSCTCGEVGSKMFAYGAPSSDHTFDKKNVSDEYLASYATESSPALYYYSCACGEAADETFEHGDVLHVHSYTVKNTSSKYLKNAATASSAAVYYYSCDCGEAGDATFTYGTPASIPISESEFLRIVNIAALKDFTLKALVSRDYSTPSSFYTLYHKSTSYYNSNKYYYDGEYYYSYDLQNVVKDTSSGASFVCHPFNVEIGPEVLYSYLSYNQLEYDSVSGIYTVTPTASSAYNGSTKWNLDKVYFTVKNGNISTFSYKIYRSVTDFNGGYVTVYNSYSYEFSAIGSTRVPGFTYSDSETLDDATLQGLLNSTNPLFNNFTLTTAHKYSDGATDKIYAYYNGKCLKEKWPDGSVEYYCNAGGYVASGANHISYLLGALDGSKFKLATGYEGRYVYSQSYKLDGITYSNITLTLENGMIKSLSYTEKDSGTTISTSHVFSSIGTTKFDCPNE